MSPHPRPNIHTQSLGHILERLDDQPPFKRLLLAGEVHQQLLDAMADLAKMRRTTIRDLRAKGGPLSSYAAIGRQIGVTTSRVKQIEGGWKRK